MKIKNEVTLYIATDVTGMDMASLLMVHRQNKQSMSSLEQNQIDAYFNQ